MPRYWVIAPVESKPSELFDKVWQFDLHNNLISIGWSQLGDVSKMSHEELSKAIALAYPEKPPPARGLIANMFWAFYYEIVPGDFIIARRGRKELAAIGNVTQPAVYAPGKNPAMSHPNFLEVEWRDQPRDKVFPAVVFPMWTLDELTEVQYNSFVQDMPPSPPEDSIEDEDSLVVDQERYLEDIIVSNFDTIFGGRWTLCGDAREKYGQQYATTIGLIDILAFEPASDSFVVIELKKGRPSDKVVGQILRYMGWVKKNLCKDGQAVKGLVICRDLDPKLSYALDMTNNIDVRYYSVSCKLREAP